MTSGLTWRELVEFGYGQGIADRVRRRCLSRDLAPEREAGYRALTRVESGNDHLGRTATNLEKNSTNH